MPPEDQSAEAKLQKLGARLRSGWAKQHPIGEQSLSTVRDAVRAEHERQQTVQRTSPPEPPAKSRGPQPPEPGDGR